MAITNYYLMKLLGSRKGNVECKPVTKKRGKQETWCIVENEIYIHGNQCFSRKQILCIIQ